VKAVSTHREVEATFAPDDAAEVPDLTDVDGVQQVRHEPPVEMTAIYFDTADLTLLRSGVSLRRRTGGSDEGWHLKVPAGGDRDEIGRPLGRSVRTPPKHVSDLALGWTRGAALVPVATVTTSRSPTLLLDRDGEVLAEFADDRVTGTTPDGPDVRWREWELELVEGPPELIEAADRQLEAAGVPRAGVSRKVERVLGDRVPSPPPVQPPEGGAPVSRLVHARLTEQVGKLAQHDVGARQGFDADIHKMRVTCRRLRALLASFRDALDRDRTDPVREELRWLVGALGGARDSTVVHEQLRRLVDEQPPSMVHGPVRRRLRSTYAGRGKPALRSALRSPRYFALRESLDQLVAHTPWSDLADTPARELAPKVLRKELKRYRKRSRAAAALDDPTDALHEARKAAKRLRYAAETLEPIGGKAVRHLVRDARRVTSHLGELQDTAVSRSELQALAETAASAGEPTFTYGRLHAREELRAEQLISAYRESDAVAMLKAGTKDAKAAAGK